jgi:hypothetical protein
MNKQIYTLGVCTSRIVFETTGIPEACSRMKLGLHVESGLGRLSTLCMRQRMLCGHKWSYSSPAQQWGIQRENEWLGNQTDKFLSSTWMPSTQGVRVPGWVFLERKGGEQSREDVGDAKKNCNDNNNEMCCHLLNTYWLQVSMLNSVSKLFHSIPVR